MEDLVKLEEIIRAYAPQVVIYGLMGLGALVVMAMTYVAVTPSKEDDAMINKLYSMPLVGAILNLFVAFSPIQKKEQALKLSNKGEIKKDA